MTHDPMHTNALGDGDGCRVCDLIARVREDMALQYLVTDREQQEAEQRAYKRGLALARGEAIEHYQQGYANGVAAAREAVADALPKSWGLATALAAIDALKEKP